MNLSAIITQLETVDGLDGKVVVGQPAQTDSLSVGPVCWISDLLETATPNQRVNTPAIQRIEVRLGLTLGAADLDSLLATRDAIRLAMIDFQPDAPGDPLIFRGGRLDFLDPGYVLWRDEYSYSFYIDMLETLNA